MWWYLTNHWGYLTFMEGNQLGRWTAKKWRIHSTIQARTTHTRTHMQLHTLGRSMTFPLLSQTIPLLCFSPLTVLLCERHVRARAWAPPARQPDKSPTSLYFLLTLKLRSLPPSCDLLFQSYLTEGRGPLQRAEVIQEMTDAKARGVTRAAASSHAGTKTLGLLACNAIMEEREDSVISLRPNMDRHVGANATQRRQRQPTAAGGGSFVSRGWHLGSWGFSVLHFSSGSCRRANPTVLPAWKTEHGKSRIWKKIALKYS